MEKSDWMRPAEAAKVLSVHPQTPRLWDRQGKLEPIRLTSHLHALAQTVFRSKGKGKGKANAWAKTVGEPMEAEGPLPVLEALSAL